MPCTYCVGVPDWIVKKYDFWTVYLKKNQAYLGTMIVALNRHTPDLFSVNAQELGELQEIMQRLSGAVKELFGAKMFAYMAQTSLENLHANIQIIPRYDAAPQFSGMEFTDRNFGRGYDPVRIVDLQPGAYSELIDLIKDKLEGKREEPEPGEEGEGEPDVPVPPEK